MTASQELCALCGQPIKEGTGRARSGSGQTARGASTPPARSPAGTRRCTSNAFRLSSEERHRLALEALPAEGDEDRT
jgi:hypothetical protein